MHWTRRLQPHAAQLREEVAPLRSVRQDHDARLQLALQPLQDLSRGDALGEPFFYCALWIRDRRLPPPVWHYTDDTVMAAGIQKALDLPREASVGDAVCALGNGSRITVPDTVPFTRWCAAPHIDGYVEAFWTTVSALGDSDTTCAIVGGNVSLSVDPSTFPDEWIDSREPLPVLTGR